MPKTARKQVVAAAPDEVERAQRTVFKKQKLSVLLITADEALWPQIGADLPPTLILKQLDNIEELINATQSGQPGIVLWDARGNADPAAVLSRLNLHSSRFAIVALDNAATAGAWTLPLQHRQIIAHVALPITGSMLAKALENAAEEVNARMALLGDGSSPAAHASPAGGKRFPVLPAAIAGGVLVVAVAAYLLTRHGDEKAVTAAAPAQPGLAASKVVENKDEKVDALIEKAQQAMNERHFIDPVAGSALSLYRDVLIMDPNNGEARQGLQRLAEILIARVQSALDERKFDVALQFLESARSIDASDRRLSALDERIASLRAELGPAQIMAAINAQNFDRATQLIDEAARARSLPVAKLNQLREEVRRRSSEADLSRLTKLVDSRLQQDKLVEPRNDSAAYYLEQAKQAGAPAASLQPQYQELQKRLAADVHTAIEQRKLSDADRLIGELRNLGTPSAVISGLQHDLGVARGAIAAPKPETPNFLELAQSRLAQGKLTDPDSDSALYYLNQLKGADPKNAGLASLSGQVQAQILERARATLDGGDVARAENLLQAAASLGNTADIEAFADKLRQKKAAGGEKPQVQEQSLTRLNKLEISYPYRAMQAGTEGWVEIGYTVKTDGTVSEVKVLNSSPAGTFEAAATKAVSRLKYQPVVRDGRVTAVGTQVRVVFRIPK